MESLRRDLRHAARSLLRSRALTVTAVLTLGLALGANTALFSLVNAVLLRPLPGIAEPARLVNVHRSAADGTSLHGFSHPDYRDLAERGRRFAELAAFNGRGTSLGTGGAPEVVGTQVVSGNYFAVLGVRPMRGRLIGPTDDGAPGASPVAVVSHSLWQRRLGGDPGVVGRTIRLNGFPFTVVGVAPEGFEGHFVGFPFDVFVPLSMAAQAAPDEDLAARDSQWLELVGRLAPGVSRWQAQAGLAAEPGVESASLATSIPLRSLAPPTADLRADGPVSASEPGLTAALSAVTPAYFETLRVPLVGGRAFVSADSPTSRPVVVVNETLARRLWPGRFAVGERLWQGAVQREVVGVARDVKVRSLGEDPQPQIYVPLAQGFRPRARLLVRGEGDLAAAVRRQVAALAPDLPVMESTPLREAITFALFPQRMAAAIAGALGILGLALAATGLYGVVAYSASLRTREMGVRAALGARHSDLMALVLGRGLRLALAGVAAGGALAAVLTRAGRSLLHGVSPTDAPTFLAVALLMTAVTALASYLPARRAARVDPMTALRSE